MKKNDCIIIISMLVITAVMFIFINITKKNDGLYALVLVDGKEFVSLELKEPSYEYTIETEYGKNILRVERDGISVIEADCSSQTCVNFGKILYTNQMIACLPHHLTITLEGGEHAEADFDAVAN